MKISKKLLLIILFNIIFIGYSFALPINIFPYINNLLVFIFAFLLLSVLLIFFYKRKDVFYILFLIIILFSIFSIIKYNLENYTKNINNKMFNNVRVVDIYKDIFNYSIIYKDVETKKTSTIKVSWYFPNKGISLNNGINISCYGDEWLCRGLIKLNEKVFNKSG